MNEMDAEKIERHVERAMDRLDKRFMRGEFTQAEYDVQTNAIDAWACGKYAQLHECAA